MTVSSATNRNDYTGNGSTTSFAVSFRFLENSHIKATLRDALSTETLQAETTDYTLTGAGGAGGGTLVMIVAPPSGTTLTIQRDVPATQETDYVENDEFPAESHEDALDKLTMLVQQQGEDSTRHIGFSDTVSDATGAAVELSQDATQRADTFLGFDALGNIVTKTASVAGLVDQGQQDKRYGPTFATVAAMVAANPVSIDGVVVNLVAGMTVHLQGRITTTDGGGGEFLVSAGDTSTGFARLLADNGTTLALQGVLPNVIQYGLVNDGVTDSSAAHTAIKADLDSFIWVKGTYLIDGVIRDIDSTAIETNDGLPVDRSPYYLMWSGQSNALGSAEARAGHVGLSTDIIDGVFVFDQVLGVFKKPVWGTVPLNGSGSNNAGIECGMEIKRQTGRDVYVMVNAEGGQSIEEWVGTGTTSRLWSVDADSVTQILSASGVPRIDGIGWMQGEQDHNGRTAGFDTTAEYRTALNTLMDQYAALPEFTDHTYFITSGVPDWAGQTGYARNDVLLTLNEDERTWVGNISTNGTTFNTDDGATSSHWSNDSLAIVGWRMANRFMGVDVGDVTVYTGLNGGQGARSPFNGVHIDGGTVTVDPMDIKGGAYYQVSNTSFDLPDPIRYEGAEIIINVTTHATTDTVLVQLTTGTIYIDGETSSGTSIRCESAGIWRFKSMNGRLYLIERPYIQKNFDEHTLNNAARTLSAFETDGEVWRVDGAALSLPDPAELTGMEVDVFQYATVSGASTVDLAGAVAGKFLDSTGAIVNSIVIPATAGKLLRLKAINTRWTVIWQNF